MRYIIGLLVTLGLIVLLLVLIFHGGGKPKVANKTIDSYAKTSSEASLTIDGPVNSNQVHQQIQIIVNKDTVKYEELQGYNGDVIHLQQFSNNENAYKNFLLALGHAGFSKGSTDPKLADDRGYCPLGSRFIYQLKNDNKVVERFWATNCGKPKSYLGNLSITNNIFKAQVPEYNRITARLKIH
ncbi:MAG: hypothetical protein NVS1B10_05170 [Candidatus Saccharimonadales bacterium]